MTELPGGTAAYCGEIPKKKLTLKAFHAHKSSTPGRAWTSQPPAAVNALSWRTPQNWLPPAFESAWLILVIKKSSNWLDQLPSKVKPKAFAASSILPMEVVPGVGLAPLFVPSHLCVPPDGVVTS